MSQTETRSREKAEAVALGSHVRLRDDEGEFECTVVTSYEHDLGRRHISADCPLAVALLGHRAGECITFRAPVGRRSVVILEVR